MRANNDLIEAATSDIAAMRASLGLQTIRRFLNQRHWTVESAHARAADDAEPGLKLESVAAHSWQVADAALLIAPNFPRLRIDRVLQLAILHDKLELITGDFDPVGSDAAGAGSHVFDPGARHRKTEAELVALQHYLSGLREPARSSQRELLLDIINTVTEEARFVKAVDKLQALTYVIEKKDGAMSDEHIAFSIRYSSKSMEFFPDITVHLGVLLQRLLERVATRQRSTVAEIKSRMPDDVQTLIAEALS